jgi:hypothetical protein
VFWMKHFGDTSDFDGQACFCAARRHPVEHFLLFTIHLRSSESWCDLVVETLPMSAVDRSCCQCHGSDAALKARALGSLTHFLASFLSAGPVLSPQTRAAGATGPVTVKIKLRGPQAAHLSTTLFPLAPFGVPLFFRRARF